MGVCSSDVADSSASSSIRTSATTENWDVPTADAKYQVDYHARENETFVVHYKHHPPREDTPLYRRTHHELCIKRDLPCFVCHRNRKQGARTETHHWFVEKADEPDVDWKLFVTRVAATAVNPQTGEALATALDWEQVVKHPDQFVDSRINMVVLCDVHHRDETRGIHHVPGPIWQRQISVQEGFQVLTKS